MKKTHPIRYILPQILTLITGQVRDLPEFEWNPENWSYNFFRALEVVFWRKRGIRAEATSILHKGREYHYFHTLEAAIVHLEAKIRSFARIPERIRVYVPVFATPGGFPMPASPFLFAIAYDNHSHTTGAGTTLSHTTSGSNRCLIGISEKTGASSWSFTYNSVALTNLDNQSTNTSNQSAILIGPASGSNTLSSGGNGTTVRVIATSYSGVGTGAGTGGCDDHGGAQGTSSGTLSNTLTLSASSWALLYVIGANNLPSATTICTTERSGGSIDASKVFDSGGALGGGSTAITSTFTDSSFAQLVVAMKVSSNTFNQAVDATTAITASTAPLKTILQAISANTGITASVATVKNAVAALTANIAVSASVIKEMALTLSATAAVSATTLAQRVFLQSMDAITAISATIETGIAKVLSATTAVSASIDKNFNVSQLLSATTNITASVDSVRGVVLEAITAISATMTTAIGKTLSATISIIGKVRPEFWRTKYPSHEDGGDYEVKYPHD